MLSEGSKLVDGVVLLVNNSVLVRVILLDSCSLVVSSMQAAS